MKRMTWVTGGLLGVVLGAGLGGCSPHVTVSRDGAAGIGGTGEGGVGATGGSGLGGAGGTGLGGAGGTGLGGAGGNTSGTAGIDGSGNEGGDDGDGVGGSGVAGSPYSNAGGTGCPQCTRRLEGTPSRLCPRGTGSSITHPIGPGGGLASIMGTPSTTAVPFSVQLFPGSLARTTELTLTELTTPPPREVFDASPIFHVEPDGLDFVNGGEVIVGTTPYARGIYYSESENGPFELLEDSATIEGFAQATLLRSGYFLAGSLRPEGMEICP